VFLLENVRFHVEEEGKGVDKDGNKVKADKDAQKHSVLPWQNLPMYSAAMHLALPIVPTVP